MESLPEAIKKLPCPLDGYSSIPRIELWNRALNAAASLVEREGELTKRCEELRGITTNYSERIDELEVTIDDEEAAHAETLQMLTTLRAQLAAAKEEREKLAKVLSVLVCDTCGRLWADDSDSDLESCTCGRFKQRMEWATAQQVEDRDTALSQQLAAAESRTGRAEGLLQHVKSLLVIPPETGSGSDRYGDPYDLVKLIDANLDAALSGGGK